MSENVGIGDVFASFFRGCTNLLLRGAWEVEEAGNEAQDPQALLGQARVQVNLEGQRTAATINRGIAACEELKLRADEAKGEWQHLEEQKQDAADAHNAEKDPEAKAQLKVVLDSAINAALIAEEYYNELAAALETMAPDADKLLTAAQQVGFRQEDLLNRATSLSVKNATADAQLALSNAFRSGGESKASALLDNAEDKIRSKTAQARADQAMAAAMPMSSADIQVSLDAIGRRKKVEAEFARLTSPQGATETK